MGRLYLRDKNDFAEIASLTIALEPTIDVDHSAIKSMMESLIEIVRKNNVLKEDEIKNLFFKKANQPAGEEH